MPPTKAILDEVLAERCTLLETKIPEWLDTAKVSGLSIAIASREDVVWQRSFGVRDQTSGIPVDDDTGRAATGLLE